MQSFIRLTNACVTAKTEVRFFDEKRVFETVYNSGYDIPYNIIYRGLINTFFPARMEIISRKPLVVLDGAHNPDGADVLANELKKHNGKVTAIIGMMRDKDCEEFLKNILCYCKTTCIFTFHFTYNIFPFSIIYTYNY